MSDNAPTVRYAIVNAKGEYFTGYRYSGSHFYPSYDTATVCLFDTEEQAIETHCELSTDCRIVRVTIG